MFCKNCGAQMADTDKVCASCGTPVAGASEPAPAPAPTPAPTPAPAPARVKTPPVGGPLEPARANPLFFAAVICLSVVAFFQLIGMIQGIGSMGQLGEILSMAGAGGVGDGLSAIFVLVSLISLAIIGVTVAGLWLTWVSGLDGTKAHLMPLGLKMIWAGILAKLIGDSIVLGLVEIVLLIGAIAGGSYAGSWESQFYGHSSYAASATGAMVLAFILLAAVMALMIIYYVKVLKTVKEAQTSVATGKLAGVPSMFVAVVTFVIAGFSLLGLLFGGLGNAMGALNTLASIGANVLFGIVMIQFRSQNATLA